VTLLIGVNNQYRDRTLEEYYWQFYSLICQAILFAKSIPEHVVVVSIPDWGLTPFNKDRDKLLVTSQIDAFNNINREIALKFKTKYINITQSTRDHAEDTNYLASDLLHYSANEYKIWAEKIAREIKL
jgi:lysophospholipase L1-like esterase